MHILHNWHNDAGLCNISSSGLGADVFVYVNTIFTLFPVHFGDARVAQMVAGKGKARRSTENTRSNGAGQ